jgi:hypothetical protein
MDRKTTRELTTVRSAVTDFTRALNVPERVQRHPYGTLAAAAGVGFVLGGGLFTRLTARLARLGLRTGAQVAMLPVLDKALEALLEGFRARGGASAPARPAE